MASNVSEKGKDKSKKQGFFKKVARYFKDMRGEMKRVVWPSKKQVINNTIVVIVFMAVMGTIVSGFDAILAVLIKLLLGV